MVASIEDVARRAGVSIATVSRALRGLPDVAAATRDRVLAAAAELDYVASPFAARLASGRTATVGLVVPWVNRWFFAEVISTVESELRRAGLDLLLYNLGDEAGRDRFFDLMPMRKRVDAVLIASLVLTDAEFDALDDLGRPVGLLGLQRPGYLSASIDDVAASRAAVDHLTALGHRRVALIGGDTDDPMAFTPPLHRRTGYREALAAVCVDVDPALERLGHFTVEGGSAAARVLLALPDRPTAMFAESDEMAYGALREIYSAGPACARGRRRRRVRRPAAVRFHGSHDRAPTRRGAGDRRHPPALGAPRRLGRRARRGGGPGGGAADRRDRPRHDRATRREGAVAARRP